MPNPFKFYNPASTAAEHQSNANYWTYAKFDAIEALQKWESNHPKQTAPCELIANVHTCKWVEKEMIYKAQQMRAAEKEEPMHELNSTRRCIKVYSTSAEAERARVQLLDLGVRLAWADDERNDIADGFGVWVQECDARGAYVRMNAVNLTL